MAGFPPADLAPSGSINLGRVPAWSGLVFPVFPTAPERIFCRLTDADGIHAEFWAGDPATCPGPDRPFVSLEWQVVLPGAGPAPWPAHYE